MNLQRCVSIVGSRDITPYAHEVISYFIPTLVEANITTISGFSSGVDYEVHKKTLDNKGQTVAIMPCGIDRIYPLSHKSLYKEILKNKGLILSEYPNTTSTAKWTYIMRNRIIAGISPITIVIEAREQSGSISTAQYAQEFRHKVFAIPNPIFNKNAKGVNSLIKNGIPILDSPYELIDKYFPMFTTPNTIGQFEQLNLLSTLNQFEKEILEKIIANPIDINELQKKCNVRTPALLSTLSKLQLASLVEEKGGIYYAN